MGIKRIAVPVHEALEWKLAKGQTLYKALCNYAELELSYGIFNNKEDWPTLTYEICAEGSEFIIEVEMGENSDDQT